ncbi:MAG: hypothetical protein IT271_02630 [Chitinophagales bacterium]|nr:hypothetical protein [Chitinophagales bacterium]
MANSIYVAGYEANSNNIYVAKYWKDKQPIELSDGNRQAYTTGIHITQNEDVYVSGAEISTTTIYYRAIYWKNGIPHYLSDGTTNGVANDICVIGDDTYICGEVETSFSNYVAHYWKNGQPVTLGLAGVGTYANAITVVNGDVYVAGYEVSPVTSLYTPVYWKNDVRIPLSDPDEYYIVHDIFVDDNNNIFIAGVKLKNGVWIGVVWRNGIVNYINDSEICSVCVFPKKNELFFAGRIINTNRNSSATAWKNYIPTKLTTDKYNALAKSIKIHNIKKYTAGNIERKQINIAVYWENRIIRRLTDGKKNAYATDIFIR